MVLADFTREEYIELSWDALVHFKNYKSKTNSAREVHLEHIDHLIQVI